MHTQTDLPVVTDLVAMLEGTAGPARLAADVACHFHFPGQDFGVRGARALTDMLADVRPTGADVEQVTAQPTPDGFVAEIRYTTRHNRVTYETVTIGSVRAGQIVRLVHYCTGGRPS